MQPDVPEVPDGEVGADLRGGHKEKCFEDEERATGISGEFPHEEGGAFVGENAGNACCPLLILEALLLVSPPEIRANFPIRDLRHIWLRKLGIAHPLTSLCPAFPSPVDVTILLRHEDVTVACRFQGLATVAAILLRIPQVFKSDPEDLSLFLEGELLPPDSPLIAYDLYGKVIRSE